MYKFSQVELRDFSIAFIVLSVSFSISAAGMNAMGIISVLPIVMFGVGVGFILHDI